jgi:hypothetical protein
VLSPTTTSPTSSGSRSYAEGSFGLDWKGASDGEKRWREKKEWAAPVLWQVFVFAGNWWYRLRHVTYIDAHVL